MFKLWGRGLGRGPGRNRTMPFSTKMGIMKDAIVSSAIVPNQVFEFYGKKGERVRYEVGVRYDEGGVTR